MRQLHTLLTVDDFDKCSWRYHDSCVAGSKSVAVTYEQAAEDCCLRDVLTRRIVGDLRTLVTPYPDISSVLLATVIRLIYMMKMDVTDATCKFLETVIRV